MQQILSTLLQDDVRDEVNARKRGEPIGGGAPDLGGRHANYGGAGPSGRPSPGGQGGGMTKLQCYRCQQFGHVKAGCKNAYVPRDGAAGGAKRPTGGSGNSAAGIKCHKCGEYGHKKADCGAAAHAATRDGKGGGYCEFCRKPGHQTKGCNEMAKVHARMLLSEDAEGRFDARKGFSGYMIQTSVKVFSTRADGQGLLILDSGATDHIFPDRKYFHTYDDDVRLQMAHVYTADDKPHSVKGVGIVCLEVNNGSEMFEVALRALYVTSLG